MEARNRDAARRALASVESVGVCRAAQWRWGESVGQSAARTPVAQMMAGGSGHATMADVTTAMSRARQFIEHRRAAVEEDVGEFGFSGMATVAVAAHRMAAHAHHARPQDAQAEQDAAPSGQDARARFLAAGGGGGGSIFAAKAPAPESSPEEYPSPSSVAFSASRAGSYAGTPGGLAQRSRQLRAMRGFDPAARSPAPSAVGSAYGAPSAASFAPSTPGNGSPGELRNRAQRLRESKSSASWVAPDYGTPSRLGSAATGGGASVSGARAASPWRGGSPNGVAESQSVRMRAYNLLQQKKGPGATPTAFGHPSPAPTAGAASARAFSPARPPATRSPTPEAPSPLRATATFRSASPARSTATARPASPVANQLYTRNPTTGRDRLRARHTTPGMDPETEQVVAELRTIFKSKQIDLYDAFGQFDTDGNHIIDAEEFRRGLKKLDIALTERQIDGLLRAMDVDGDGQIDYFEFAKQYGVQRGQAAKQLLSRKAADRDAAAKDRSAERRKPRRGKEDTAAFLNKLRTISSQTPEPRSRDKERTRSPARERSRARSKSPERPPKSPERPSTPPAAAASTASSSATGTDRKAGRKSMAEKAALLAAAREEVSGGRRAAAASPPPSAPASTSRAGASTSRAGASTSRADALLERSRAQRQTTERDTQRQRDKTPERPRSKSVLKERAQKMQEERQKKGGTRKR